MHIFWFVTSRKDQVQVPLKDLQYESKYTDLALSEDSLQKCALDPN